MTSLFRWSGQALLPLRAALTLDERRKVRSIPGAQVDEATGETFGAEHTLATVAEVFGAQGAPRRKGAGVRPVTNAGLSPYQDWGVAQLERSMKEGSLCHDDVGVGKTPQAIAALAGLPLVKLVLCPGFLRSQWAAEIKRWTKTFRGVEEHVHIVKPVSLVRKSDEPLTPAAGSWVVAFYREATRALDAISVHHAQPYALIVDEAHNLRSLGTIQTREVKDAATFASARVGLTGDALVNDIPHLYPVLDIIQPGGFGSYYDFIKRYCGAVPDDYSHLKTMEPTHQDELRRRLDHFSYRRTWDDIPASERPFNTMMQTVWVPVREGHRALRSILVKGIGVMQYAESLAEAKMEAVSDAVLNDLRAGIPSVTFALTRAHARQLSHVVKGLYVSSDIPNATRLEYIARYVRECALKKKPPQVFATYGSIGEGANLQWAKVVNFAALPFGSDVIRQAFARAARRGNSGVITARFFVAKRTADEGLVELIQKKLKMQLTLVGKEESAKVDLISALEVSQGEIDAVMAKMLDAARAREAA